MIKSEPWMVWAFVGPTVLLLAVMMYWPMLGTVLESFQSTNFLGTDAKFVGLELYRKLFASGDVWTIVRNSFVWTLGVVVLQNLIGFGIALLLNQNLPGQGFMRALILLPWIVPGVVAAILWRFMYDPQLGIINAMLIGTGLSQTGIAWLGDETTAMASAVIAAVWKGFPFSTLIFLAALQNVDREQIEAATIDGAGAVRRLFDVVLPGMREVIVVNVILTTILTFNYFDMVWVLTRGGPRDATHIFPTKIFELGFGQFRFGEAATYGVLSILVLSVLVALYFVAQGSGAKRRATA